jgi:histidyl-tRNA synthetase
MDRKENVANNTSLTSSTKKEKRVNTNESKRGRNVSKGIIETEPVIGTRDFPPPEMRLRNWLFGHFREVARLFAFQEYDAPILEPVELYRRKAGDAAEDITKQMYTFVDKDDYEVTLRPEMTPSLARLIIKQGGKMLLPIRWFSIPQCWRFENTTRGRKREHYQWNMDIVGVSTVTAEAEILAAIVTFFERVGLTSKDVVIKVNSRKVLQSVLEPLGVTKELFAPVCIIVDKLDKLSKEEVERELTNLKLEKSVIDKINQTLTLKDLEALEKILGPEAEAVKELRELFKLAKGYGYEDWLQFDASIVRGLAYYTGIVFEGKARPPIELRAICGGGRYDKLLSLYGGKDVPAVGFGFGDCVIMELLNEKNLCPHLEPSIDDVVVPFDETMREFACAVAAKLRKKGHAVDVQLIPKKKLAWCYEYADRVGAQRVVLIAPDEWSKGLVRVKFLRETDESKKQVDIPLSDL